MSFTIDGAIIPCASDPKKIVKKLDGTFRWDKNKDVMLLREVLSQEPFLERVGSKESGMKWSYIATSLNTHVVFKENPRDQRSVREHFNKLLNEFSSKKRKEENESGSSPADPTESEVLLEEIHEKVISAKSDASANNTAKTNERAKALSIREKAMTTWGKKRKSDGDDQSTDTCKSESDDEESRNVKPVKSRKRRKGVDAVTYLQQRYESEAELKREEMDLKKEQFSLEQAKLDLEKQKQQQLQEQVVEQQKQIVLQQQQQQQQLQQQMQAQAQNQALILTLLSKLAK